MRIGERIGMQVTRAAGVVAASLMSVLAGAGRLGAQAINPPHSVEFKFGDATGAPGASVSVPFFIRLDAPGQGYSFSADFDEGVLEVTAIDSIFRNPDGTPTFFEKYEFNNDDRTPGNAGVDEGFLLGGVIFNPDNWDQLPPAQDNLMAVIHFLVRPGVEVNATEIRFLDGAPISSDQRPIANNMTIGGRSYTPDTLASFVLISGRINIIPDGTPFVRGDSNDDGTVDISDPTATLGYLFLGAQPPRCLKAADENDDGQIDVTDAIGTLEYLFLGGSRPLAPFPAPGFDQTADALGCRDSTP